MSESPTMPFDAGRFYDAEAVAWAFASAGGVPVSARTVRRWLGSAPELERAKVTVGGRSWWPGAALVRWVGSGAAMRAEAHRDAARGVFISARTEGELRRKVVALEVANG